MNCAILLVLCSLVTAVEPSRLVLADGHIIEPALYYPDEGRLVVLMAAGKASRRIDPATVERVEPMTADEVEAALAGRPAPARSPEQTAAIEAVAASNIARSAAASQAKATQRAVDELADLKAKYAKAVQIIATSRATDARLAQEYPLLQQQQGQVMAQANALVTQITMAQDRWNQEVDLYGPKRIVKTVFNNGGVEEGGPLPATVKLLNTLNAQRDALLKQSETLGAQMEANSAQRKSLAEGIAAIQGSMAEAQGRMAALDLQIKAAGNGAGSP